MINFNTAALFLSFLLCFNIQCPWEKSRVIMQTSQGIIEIELEPDKSPVTVKNFLNYCDQGFYNGTIFHRVVPEFVAEAGGYTADLKPKKTAAPIVNESPNGLSNLRGTISMARKLEIDSATSQFFFNLEDNAFLDHGYHGYGYCVFGRVVKGMDVVEKIASAATHMQNQFEYLPTEQIVIISLRNKKITDFFSCR